MGKGQRQKKQIKLQRKRFFYYVGSIEPEQLFPEAEVDFKDTHTHFCLLVTH